MSHAPSKYLVEDSQLQSVGNGCSISISTHKLHLMSCLDVLQTPELVGRAELARVL